MGVALFIVSEVFAFVSVFWAYFHSSLAPTIELGSSWPPVGIEPLDPFAIPLLNTILLLSSGVCHKCEFSCVHSLVYSILLVHIEERNPDRKQYRLVQPPF